MKKLSLIRRETVKKDSASVNRAGKIKNKAMKILLVSITMLGAILSSCGTSKESANIMVDTMQTISRNVDANLPYQDPDRTRASVSPNAEEINTYSNTGFRGRNGTNDTIVQQELEPLKSRSTRSYNEVVTPYNNGGGEPNVSTERNP
jgi:hypothetical protein